MSLDLRADVATLREASAHLRVSDRLLRDDGFSARLLDLIADQVEFAADAAEGLACDVDVDVRPTWTAALNLARTVLGDREADQ